MTIRTSLVIATVIAITFAGAAATPQNVDKVPIDHVESYPVAALRPCERGLVRCGAACYGPAVSCCCSSNKGPQVVTKPSKYTTRSQPTCAAICRTAGLGRPRN